MPNTALSRPSPSALAQARALIAQGVDTGTAPATSVGTSRRVKTGGFKPTDLPPIIGASGKVNYRPFYQAGVAASVEVYVPTHPAARMRAGWVAAHRIVAENTIGRYLGKSEKVTFIDGNGFNFASSNLRISARVTSDTVPGAVA